MCVGYIVQFTRLQPVLDQFLGGMNRIVKIVFGWSKLMHLPARQAEYQDHP